MRLAPHAGLPVRVARGVGHHRGAPVETDRDVLARGCRQAVVAGDAPVGGLEMRSRRLPGGRGAPGRPRQPPPAQSRAVCFSISFPPVAQPAVEPVPQQIEHDLRRTGRPVLLTGIRTPTLARMCWRRLSVTWNCGTTSQLIASPVTSSRSASSSTIGDQRRPWPLSWREALAQHRAPEHGLGGIVGVSRQLRRRPETAGSCPSAEAARNWRSSRRPSRPCPCPAPRFRWAGRPRPQG